MPRCRPSTGLREPRGVPALTSRWPCDGSGTRRPQRAPRGRVHPGPRRSGLPGRVLPPSRCAPLGLRHPPFLRRSSPHVSAPRCLTASGLLLNRRLIRGALSPKTERPAETGPASPPRDPLGPASVPPQFHLRHCPLRGHTGPAHSRHAAPRGAPRPRARTRPAGARSGPSLGRHHPPPPALLISGTSQPPPPPEGLRSGLSVPETLLRSPAHAPPCSLPEDRTPASGRVRGLLSSDPCACPRGARFCL